MSLAGWNGYHDHNWGTWAGVHWDWGQAADPRHGGLVYGGVSAGALRSAASGAAPGLASTLAALYAARDLADFQASGETSANGGFAAAFRPDAIRYDGWHLRADGVRVPRRVILAARTADDSLSAVLAVRDVAATAWQVGGPRPGNHGAPRPLLFLQMHGTWTVNATFGRQRLRYNAAGAAETFIEAR